MGRARRRRQTGGVAAGGAALVLCARRQYAIKRAPIRHAEQFLHSNTERARQALEIIQTDIATGPLDGTDIRSMQAAPLRQLLLRPTLYEPQQTELLRQLFPCFILHTDIVGAAPAIVYSGLTANGLQFITLCWNQRTRNASIDRACVGARQ